MRRVARRRVGAVLGTSVTALLVTGCFGEAARPRAPIVIDPVAGRKSWAMSGLQRKLGDPRHGGTGPVEAEKTTVLAALKRRTNELERARKELTGLRDRLAAQVARVASAEALAGRASAESKRLAARVKELESERRDLVGRALEAELQRIRVEQQLVEQRLARMNEPEAADR